MDREVVIAIAEDDMGHVSLIKKNLRRSVMEKRPSISSSGRVTDLTAQRTLPTCSYWISECLNSTGSRCSGS